MKRIQAASKSWPKRFRHAGVRSNQAQQSASTRGWSHVYRYALTISDICLWFPCLTFRRVFCTFPIKRNMSHLTTEIGMPGRSGEWIGAYMHGMDVWSRGCPPLSVECNDRIVSRPSRINASLNNTQRERTGSPLDYRPLHIGRAPAYLNDISGLDSTFTLCFSYVTRNSVSPFYWWLWYRNNKVCVTCSQLHIITNLPHPTFHRLHLEDITETNPLVC